MNRINHAKQVELFEECTIHANAACIEEFRLWSKPCKREDVCGMSAGLCTI